MDVEVTEMPEMRVGVVHSDMAHPQEAWERMSAIAGPAGLMRGGTVLALYPSSVLRGDHAGAAGPMPYDAAVALPEGQACPDGLDETVVPAGRYVMSVHTGPYEGLGGSWQAFAQWLPASGYAARDALCLELYRTGPGEVPDAELRTELYIPIA